MDFSWELQWLEHYSVSSFCAHCFPMPEALVIVCWEMDKQCSRERCSKTRSCCNMASWGSSYTLFLSLTVLLVQVHKLKEELGPDLEDVFSSCFTPDSFDFIPFRATRAPPSTACSTPDGSVSHSEADSVGQSRAME